MIKRINQLVLVLGIFSLIGCGSILGPQQQTPVSQYEITNLKQVNTINHGTCESTTSIALFISGTRGVPPYDSYKMYYTTDKYKINSYGYNQWVSNPADMIGGVLATNIISDCSFRNSVTAISTANTRYRLVPFLDIIRNETGADGKMNARLAMSLLLIDPGQNYTVGAMRFDQTLPTDGTPAGFVDSINKLVSQFSTQSIEWLKDNTETAK
ncbi:MAG: ABC-type transport auxiliary lipoprotein family protein [Burkholderiales bacterium]|nr:ABC-type transport auxiliary lipoprotein family protein [Burkholderiales bacterium]